MRQVIIGRRSWQRLPDYPVPQRRNTPRLHHRHFHKHTAKRATSFDQLRGRSCKRPYYQSLNAANAVRPWRNTKTKLLRSDTYDLVSTRTRTRPALVRWRTAAEDAGRRGRRRKSPTDRRGVSDHRVSAMPRYGVSPPSTNKPRFISEELAAVKGDCKRTRRLGHGSNTI